MQRGFEEEWLGDIFSKAVMLGNGLVAILAGLLANTLVDGFSLGPVAPFDAAAVILATGGVIIYFQWPENYGNSTSTSSLAHQFSEAVACIQGDSRVLLLGLMQVGPLVECRLHAHVPASVAQLNCVRMPGVAAGSKRQSVPRPRHVSTVRCALQAACAALSQCKRLQSRPDPWPRLQPPVCSLPYAASAVFRLQSPICSLALIPGHTH
jgi:hypothetical protein